LEVDVPCIRVKDLGSTNGTYINGREIESDSREAHPTTRCDPDCSPAILTNGDILTVGGTSLKVEVVDCPPAYESDQGDPALWKPGEIAKKNCRFC
jgi:pSer/pThr/pTyr-binding forkhead associated (FHA) protein